jgi:hypothetical protein
VKDTAEGKGAASRRRCHNKDRGDMWVRRERWPKGGSPLVQAGRPRVLPHHRVDRHVGVHQGSNRGFHCRERRRARGLRLAIKTDIVEREDKEDEREAYHWSRPEDPAFCHIIALIATSASTRHEWKKRAPSTHGTPRYSAGFRVQGFRVLTPSSTTHKPSTHGTGPRYSAGWGQGGGGLTTGLHGGDSN